MLVALVMAGACAGILTTLLGGGSKPDVATNPATPTVAGASDGAKIVAWYTGGGKERIDNIEADFQLVEADGAAGDADEVRSDCTVLQSDVVLAQRYKPIPVAAAQKPWAAALAEYAKGAQDCADGAERGDASLLTKAAGEMAKGTADMADLNAVIAKYE